MDEGYDGVRIRVSSRIPSSTWSLGLICFACLRGIGLEFSLEFGVRWRDGGYRDEDEGEIAFRDDVVQYPFLPCFVPQHLHVCTGIFVLIFVLVDLPATIHRRELLVTFLREQLHCAQL